MLKTRVESTRFFITGDWRRLFSWTARHARLVGVAVASSRSLLVARGFDFWWRRIEPTHLTQFLETLAPSFHLSRAKTPMDHPIVCTNTLISKPNPVVAAEAKLESRRLSEASFNR